MTQEEQGYGPVVHNKCCSLHSVAMEVILGRYVSNLEFAIYWLYLIQSSSSLYILGIQISWHNVRLAM